MNQSNFKGYPSPPCALTRPKQEELSLSGPSNRKAGGKSSSKTTDGAGSVPEFIQKLFRMLENKAFKHTFCWGVDGTTFIVKDTNEFSKTILPKHFKHCNFASFVRQLNKYDFHKVRNADDGHRPYGDQAWEFVHPRFMRDRKDLLEEIRRKTPGKAKKEETLAPANWNEDSVIGVSEGNSTGEHNRSRQQQLQSTLEPGNPLQSEEMRKVTQNLQQQIKELQQSRIEMESYLQKLNNTDCLILQELLDLGKQMQIKDNLIKDILKNHAVLNKESTGKAEYNMDTQTLLDSFATVSQSNSDQLERITQQLKSQSHHMNLLNKSTDQHSMNTSIQQHIPNSHPSYPVNTPPVPSSSAPDSKSNMASSVPLIIPTQQPNLDVTASAAAAAASMNAGSLIGSPLKTGDGLTFVTLGRLSSNTTVRDNKAAFEITPSEPSSSQHESKQQHNLQPLSQQQQQTSTGVADATSTSLLSPIRPTTSISQPGEMYSGNGAISLKRKMNIAGWTVPPRVLLVDDDSVYRDLSGKLLQVIGCSIDLAKDGVEALRKMGLEKYDLILMDIVMPNLDGISATRNIRQYDALTPIISMTSNFTDSDIMQYIGSGMTDILPKPFSKKTLYSMLEKYCAHLKAIQRVHRVQDQAVPRPLDMLGLLPPPDQNHAKSTSTSSTSSPSVSTPVSSGSSVKTAGINIQLLPPQTKMEDPDVQMQIEPHLNSSSSSTATPTTTTPPTSNTEATNTFSIGQSHPYSFPLTMDSLSSTGLSLQQQQQHSYSASIPTNTTSAFYNTGNPD